MAYLFPNKIQNVIYLHGYIVYEFDIFNWITSRFHIYKSFPSKFPCFEVNSIFSILLFSPQGNIFNVAFIFGNLLPASLVTIGNRYTDRENYMKNISHRNKLIKQILRQYWESTQHLTHNWEYKQISNQKKINNRYV